MSKTPSAIDQESCEVELLIRSTKGLVCRLIDKYFLKNLKKRSIITERSIINKRSIITGESVIPKISIII